MSATQRGADALEQARREGYRERSDGRWETPDGEVLPHGVDPKPVQEAAIEVIFQRGTNESEAPGLNTDFNIWSIVERALVREGDSLADNYQRVYDQWVQVGGEETAEEAARQLEAMGHDLRDGA